MTKYQITNQVQIRKLFWENYPNMPRKQIKNHAGTGRMYCTDTRCAFVDFVDYLSKDGQISEALASRATL